LEVPLHRRLRRHPGGGHRQPRGPALGLTGADAQLLTIAWLDERLSAEGIDYWVFGGWAVDLHAGRLTRDHADVDVAVWASDLARVRRLLEDEGWTHVPEPGEQGYTGFERGSVRLELAFLARDGVGTVHTPLPEGRGEWPPGSFGEDRAGLGGVAARVVGLASLVEDKSGPRDDPAAQAKDRADVAVLTPLTRRPLR
jgi:Aminoglycoside-2''-adenylyltransferase